MVTLIMVMMIAGLIVFLSKRKVTRRKRILMSRNEFNNRRYGRK